MTDRRRSTLDKSAHVEQSPEEFSGRPRQGGVEQDPSLIPFDLLYLVNAAIKKHALLGD
jgi:hypothetical protein